MDPVVMGALVLTAGALLGAIAPSVTAIWERHRDALLTTSAGLLTGTALLHLLPHATGLGEELGWAVLLGFFGVLLLEAGLHGALPEVDGHHAHEPHHHEHLHLDHEGVDAHEVHLPVSAFVGFSLHGLVDGAALTAAGAAGTVFTTTLALLAHHMPLAASYASLLKLGGRPRAFWPLVGSSAVMPLLGVVLTRTTTGGPHVTMWVSGVAAGVFIYVATHNLLPVVDLKKDKALRLFTLLGGAAVAAITHVVGG
ncbi:MAG: ZIP family metal transporter [Myxococcota bacterium]